MINLRIALLTTLVCIFAAQCQAHSKLGSMFKKEYRLRTVSCHACHLKAEKEKSKDAMTPMGKELVKLLDKKQVSERIADLKGQEKPAQDKVWAVIEKEFKVAMKQLEEKKTPEGRPYIEAIREGAIDGIRIRKR